jgi:hypothetical protein
MSDAQSSFDPYAPPNPAVADQLREFGLTAREADQFATVLAMGSDGGRLGLARLLAPSLVAGSAAPPDLVRALVEALELYAEPAHWSVDGTFAPNSPESAYRPDCGDTARAALQRAKEAGV